VREQCEGGLDVGVLADEQAQRFQRVIDSCADAFVEIDANCLVTEWSTRCEELLGWTRTEMLGRTIFDVVADQSTDVVEQGVAVFQSMVASEGDQELVVGQQFPGMAFDVLHQDGSVVATKSMVFLTATSVDNLRIGAFLRPAFDPDQEAEQVQARHRLYDPLTGLPNRALFTRRLGVALDEGTGTPGSVAVVVLALDRFKAINDGMGHDAGDDLLIAVAARLRLAGRGVRPMLSRLGGDEFLALFEDPNGKAGEIAESFARRVMESFDEPFDIADTEIFVSASIGIAAAQEADTTASVVLSNAEAAMHETKVAGGKAVKVFGESMRRQVVDRLTTEHFLHRALDRRELTLFYQPVVDISGASPVGVEALIRWRHPELGLVAPDRFIPVAEESGLIIPIGAWVLEEACNQLRHWRRDGYDSLSGMMEVNLSARQIDHPGIVSTVEAILEAAGLPPDKLTLEITESALMRDAVAALQVLRALKSIGVSLAIDDFGTGYSSLSYLQRFPLDVLKVDKSFVDELDQDQGTEIVAAVINLAHALGLNVVAEGVETEHQLKMLQELKCDFAQGYLFSRPVPASDLVGALSIGA
jgi:diguanylate cyclase (GGDEF)-like protein/PAS domain S-box-containing protein